MRSGSYYMGALVTFALLGLAWIASSVAVSPVVQTPSVDGSGDVADDPAIWVHPTDASRSMILGTSKHSSRGGLYAYDLEGRQIGKYASGKRLNNTDLRYDFPLGDSTVDLIGASNRTDRALTFFAIDPAMRTLTEVGQFATDLGEPYGFCMYRSPVDGSFYAITTARSSGRMEQYRLHGGTGTVRGTRVRRIDIGSIAEGCVADEEHRALYIGEEQVALWKYGAEPSDGSARTKIDDVGGHLAADIEGLAIYRTSDGGYIIASSQGNSTLQVYDRISGAHVGQFRIGSSNTGIDGVSGTDGIDVSNISFGGRFSKGLFVAHDNANSGGSTSNFKFVRWEDIAGPGWLAIDTSYSPRGVGFRGDGDPGDFLR